MELESCNRCVCTLFWEMTPPPPGQKNQKGWGIRRIDLFFVILWFKVTGVSGCLIVNKNRIVVLRITCSIVKLVQGRWIVARSIVFLLLIFFIRYVGGEGRRKRRHEKSHDAAHLQNRRWGALYLKSCSPTLCPNNGMAAVRSKFFYSHPHPPHKRGENCPPPPDVTFL